MTELHPSLNTLLLVVALALIVHLLLRARSWTVPAQEARMAHMERRIERVTGIAEAAERSITDHRREMVRSLEGLLDEMRKLGDRMSELSTQRADISELQLATVRLDQDSKILSAHVQALACSETKWHSTERPGFCPLHQEPCPLNGSKEPKS